MVESAAGRTFLFDLDGTLVDSFQAIQASVNYVRASHQLDALPLSAVRRAVGNGLRKLVARTIPLGDLETNARLFAEHHPTVLLAGSAVLPGVRQTLAELTRRGCKLGVCSNKPIKLTRRLLDLLDLLPVFSVVLGPELVPLPKPAPDMLAAALEALGAAPGEVLYVGDMTIDVETARAAGVTVWVIATGSQTEEELIAGRPDRLMHDFSELLELVPVANPAAELAPASVVGR